MTRPLVRQGRKNAPLTPFRDPGDVPRLRSVGGPDACDLCGGASQARATNQRFCGPACATRRRRLDAAHEPALVALAVTFARFRKGRRGAPEHRLAMVALRDLRRRGRELRDRLDDLNGVGRR